MSHATPRHHIGLGPPTRAHATARGWLAVGHPWEGVLTGGPFGGTGLAHGCYQQINRA
jgi:hypothetical protein